MPALDESTTIALSSIPRRAGVGLKAQHYHEILETKPDVGWFEFHPENYMGAGGPPHKYLSAIRESYPLSLHGVSLSLGSAEPLNQEHLKHLRHLIHRYEPDLVSEHIAWCSLGGTYFDDLIALPYTEETLNIVCDHVSETQDFLGRQILVENPATYLQFQQSEIPEPEFLLAVIKRTGCGILLDVNNAYVAAQNHGFDAAAYIDQIPAEFIGEIHLSGHTLELLDGAELRIDDHGCEVIDDVWSLYSKVMQRAPHAPVLIEWDTRIPEWSVLLGQARMADRLANRIAKKEPNDVALA